MMNVCSIAKVRNTFSLCYMQIRNSRYAAKSQEPTFRKDDLEEELNEDDPRKYNPIKAPANFKTSFATYDDLVEKFIRLLMNEGNKRIARYVVFKAFENIKLSQIDKFNKATDFEKGSIELNPFNVFSKAVENCKPLLKLDKVSRGGVVYQVPVPLSANSMVFFAMKWLIESADDKYKAVKLYDTLAQEILDASANEGKSVKKKQELHRLCEANRAYAHFRW